MREDVFNPTRYTLIDGLMARGTQGRDELIRHIMQVYAWPLKVYLLGCNAQDLGDPDEVINGFLLNRLQRDSYLTDWRKSGLKLRRWLCNGLCLYMRELRKSIRTKGGMGLPDDTETFDGEPGRAVERAYLVSVVREALRVAGEECEQRGLSDQWFAFRRHYDADLTYQELGRELNVSPERADTMVRTGKRRFAAALRELLAVESEDPSALDEEIRLLLKI